MSISDLEVTRPAKAIAISSRRSGWIWHVVLFLMGTVTGAAATFGYLSGNAFPNNGGPPHISAESIFKELKEELRLRDDQLETMREVVIRNHSAFEELRHETHEKWRAKAGEFEKEVASHLDAEQNKLWNARIARMRAMFDRHGKKKRDGKPRSGESNNPQKVESTKADGNAPSR